jgi:hypothetical protein
MIGVRESWRWLIQSGLPGAGTATTDQRRCPRIAAEGIFDCTRCVEERQP